MSGDAEFAFSVLSKLHVTQPNRGLSYSPFLLRRLLAAAATGADEQNRQQITAVTGSYQDIPDMTVQTIRAATDIAVITDSELVSGYPPGIPDVHVHREDNPRTAEETTISWIREQTGLEIDIIRGVFMPGDIELTSALAFSGALLPAEGGNEMNNPFAVDNGSTQYVNTYFLEGTYRIGADEKGHYAQLPFAEGGLFLTLYVPDSITEDFGPFLAAYSEGSWFRALQDLSPAGASVRLPKVKFRMTSRLNEVIAECLQGRPVFSGTASGETLFLGNILQTTEWSYTATFLNDRTPPDKIRYTVDAMRPFIYTIGNQSNSVLIAAGIYRGV